MKIAELEVRPAWKRFIELCEQKLKKHDPDYGPEGWKGAPSSIS